MKYFDVYQDLAHMTAIYPSKDLLDKLVYCSLGLAGEAGEFSNKVKKILRDDRKNLTFEKVLELEEELGDVLWYLTEATTILGNKLSTIAQMNINKLKDRQKRDKLKGRGDKR